MPDTYACMNTFPADTQVGYYIDTGVVASAATHFYFGTLAVGLGYPNWDLGAPNFHSAVQKIMAHEIGHTMGIKDQPLGAGDCGGQTAGQSVMNALCGTNDSANNLPAPAPGLPPCDNASVW
jgi:hypothetical protein